MAAHVTDLFDGLLHAANVTRLFTVKQPDRTIRDYAPNKARLSAGMNQQIHDIAPTT